MKATEKYFLAVLFIVLYKVVLTFESVDEILKCDHLMKATEQYFPVVLFTMLYKVILTFESVDKILKDPLALTVMHCALFILIRPDMGRDLSRGKITASHLEEEMNTEFEMSVVSNFLVSTSSPVRYQKPVKHFCGLCFGPLNPPSCSSRRGHFLRLQKSHLKEK